MNANRDAEAAIAHQASEWVTVLRRTASAGELAAFADWIKISPRHIREFLAMSAIEQELHGLDLERRYGLHEIAEAAASNIVPFDGAPSLTLPRSAGEGKEAPSYPLPRTRRKMRMGAWAAAAAGVIAVVTLWSQLHSRNTFSTVTGEQRTLELADGSIVHLNTRSEVRVRISGTARDIELVSGEALFKVHRDPARPFRVHAGDTAIQAVGTEFNVYRRSEGITVAVLEGKVRISTDAEDPATPLAAGEAARITARGSVAKQTSADVASAVAWRQRRLMFQEESLTNMIREFNRYNRSPQFRLEDSIGNRRHYTGVFDADDPESLIELLSAEPDLKVERRGDEIVIAPAGAHLEAG